MVKATNVRISFLNFFKVITTVNKGLRALTHYGTASNIIGLSPVLRIKCRYLKATALS